MKTFLLGILSLCLAQLSAQTVRVSSGTLQRFENFPSQFVPARNVDVWLPDGYDSTRQYAVLYMHDGQMLFDSTSSWNGQEWGVDETLGGLIAEKKIRDCIVVGISNNGQKRHSEYFPQKPFESLSEEEKKIVQQALLDRTDPSESTFQSVSDNYLKFLVTELKPFIDTHFSTRRDRQSTMIAGSSMGGLISLYAICEYPRVFGGAACLSTHWPGIFRMENNPVPDAFLRYLDTHLPDPKSHLIYFDHGTATLDSLYKPVQSRVDSLMLKKGFDKRHWHSREFPGADHSERAWRDRLAIPISFLLPAIFYPRYEGNPIIWQGERYFGNVKSVEITRIEHLDAPLPELSNTKQVIRFSEDWKVAEHIFISGKPGEGQEIGLINRPVYGHGGYPIVENFVHPDGRLNNVCINEFNQGILVKKSDFSSFGGLSDVTEYEHKGDTIFKTQSYFNSGSKQLDDENAHKTTTVYRGNEIVSVIETLKGTPVLEWQLLESESDKYGNWIKQRCHIRILWTNGYDETTWIVLRKIEYYD